MLWWDDVEAYFSQPSTAERNHQAVDVLKKTLYKKANLLFNLFSFPGLSVKSSDEPECIVCGLYTFCTSYFHSRKHSHKKLCRSFVQCAWRVPPSNNLYSFSSGYAAMGAVGAFLLFTAVVLMFVMCALRKKGRRVLFAVAVAMLMCIGVGSMLQVLPFVDSL